MEDKTQDVKSLEDLLKAANDFRKWAIDFGNELSKILADIQASKKEENKWEMKCPYKVGDKFWILSHEGIIDYDYWDNQTLDRERLSQGCLFPTKEAAELEAKRRNLLTRFRAFRDECNGDWKADWGSPIDNKYFIFLSKNEIRVGVSCYTNPLSEFGYFKHFNDCKKAIGLFGDEIKTLFGDCEE